MKRYDKYKDSGVAWLGKVPSHWEVTKVGKHYKIVLGKMLSPQPSSEVDTYEKYFCAKDVHFEGVNKNDLKKMWFSPSEKSKYIVQNEDLLIVEGGSAGECAIIQIENDEQIFIQNSLLIARSDNNSTRFLKYFLENLVRAGYITITCNAATFVHYTKEKVCNTPFSLPPLAEQEAIAAYLDEKCEAIDGMVEKIEEKIALFQRLRRAIISRAVTRGLNPDAPLRPSGIDWIGEIPEHWEVKRMKFVSDFNPTCKRENSQDEIVDYAPMNHVRWNSIEPNTIQWGLKPTGLNYFEDGDILMAKVTPCFENGNIAIAKNLLTGQGVCSSELMIFRPKNIDVRFQFFILQHEELKREFVSSMRGTGGLKRIDPELIYNYFIPIPPPTEQQAIADYLDRKCGKIDELVAKYEQQKELLARYKKSLIAQVVTGQRRVCEPVFNYKASELDDFLISMAAEI